MVAKKKGGGGKLSRSEIVTVRLDSKLRLAAELASRKQRRTLSSFIEWAIEKAVSEEVIRLAPDGTGDTAFQAMIQTWDVEEADRFIKLVGGYPELLNYEEERLWKFIKERPIFFKKVRKISHEDSLFEWSATTNNVDNLKVRQYWERLKKVMTGEESEDAIPYESEDQYNS